MPESARFDELGIPVLQGGEDVKPVSFAEIEAISAGNFWEGGERR
jgi:hypothetical protein